MWGQQSPQQQPGQCEERSPGNEACLSKPQGDCSLLCPQALSTPPHSPTLGDSSSVPSPFEIPVPDTDFPRQTLPSHSACHVCVVVVVKLWRSLLKNTSGRLCPSTMSWLGQGASPGTFPPSDDSSAPQVPQLLLLPAFINQPTGQHSPRVALCRCMGTSYSTLTSFPH